MLKRDAIAGALCHLGMREPTANAVARVLFALQIDSFLGPRRVEVEVRLSELIENCDMFNKGMIQLDELLKSVTAINALLDSIAKLYPFASCDISESVRSARSDLFRAVAWA